MKALVIRDRWIDLILDGRKVWEMRTRPTNIRGRIALARKGSGLLLGTAELLEVRDPLTAEEMLHTRHLHGIPPDQVQTVVIDGWTTPWVLGNVQRFAQPVPYVHNKGAVTWVNVPDLPV